MQESHIWLYAPEISTQLGFLVTQTGMRALSTDSKGLIRVIIHLPLLYCSQKDVAIVAIGLCSLQYAAVYLGGSAFCV
jgi:hypothetical protein